MTKFKTWCSAAALLLSTLTLSNAANAAIVTQELRIDGENFANFGFNLNEDVLAEAIATDPWFDPTMADNFFFPDLISLESLRLFGSSVEIAEIFRLDVVFNALDLTQAFGLLSVDLVLDSGLGLQLDLDQAFPGDSLVVFDFPDGDLFVFDAADNISVVPEPSVLSALGLGLLMLVGARRKA